MSKKDRLKFLAAGGLIERRSFLMSGLAFSSVFSIPLLAGSKKKDDKIEATMPDWITGPGELDTPYGAPSEYEKSIVRKKEPNDPLTELFSIWTTPIENQRGIITPNGLHFSVCHNGIPEINPEKHSIMIHGLVKRPLKFNMEDLLRYPMKSNINFLECAGNSAHNAVALGADDLSAQELSGQISGAEWTGVPLKYLLDEVGLKPNAKWAIVEGADGGSHSRSIPVSKLLDDAIIALYQNGERIRPSQGYPCRLFLPGWEGNTNIKWVHRLELSSTPAYTKDESGLYSDSLDNGKIERFSFHMDVKSLITQPSGKQILPTKKGYYDVSGLAWSGYGKIKYVEVSADGGVTWAKANLHEPVLPKSLTKFSIPWQWSGEKSVLMSRAVDEFGRTQPTRDNWKNKYASYSFNHYNAIQAWKISSNGEVQNVYV